MKIIVIGAGAWGTALAVSAAPRHAVTLLARDAAQASAMQASRVNARYLSGVQLPAGVTVAAPPANGTGPAASNDDAALRLKNLATQQDLIVIATPLSGLREWLTLLADVPQPVAWLCKGFEHSGLLANEICAQVAPSLVAGVLSGPSFAQEVAHAQPTALVAASAHPAVRDRLVEAFHTGSLRVYAGDDIVGVEVGGAVKNVLAIATGLCDGLQLGLNARAALITRGLAEMTRLGVALGAKAETFMGLSGLGDLVLTATGDLSRNRKVGLLLAQGQSLSQATASLGHVAEGVLCARAVVQRARTLAVDMPIAQCVVALLDGKLIPAQAVALLMGREAAAENTPPPKN
jgi:glycerol-3-phosphate dehydrogenase (NAD(P)+)